MSFAGLIPIFLISPFAGVLADRWNRHRVLVITQVFAGLQSAALALITLTGHATIPILIVLNVVQGLINAFDFPIRQSLVSQMIEDRRDLPNAIALNSSMVNLARLIGPSFAGVLIATVGEGGCFAIDAFSYLAVIATLLMMRFKPRELSPEPPKRVLIELREGLNYARHHRTIFTVLLLFALVSLSGTPYLTLLPMVVAEKLTADARWLGYLTATAGFGALCGAYLLATRGATLPLRKIPPKAAIGFGVGLILFGLATGYPWALITIFVAGLGMMLVTATSNTVLQTSVDEDKRGRVMSLFGTAYAGMSPIGSLIGGHIADEIGSSRTLILGGVVCAMAGFWCLRQLGSLRAETEGSATSSSP